MNIHGELLKLCFKGHRNYITGADLYTEINNVISSSADGSWVQNIKFRGFADSSCFIQFSDIDKVDDKCIRGDFSIFNSGGIVKGVLIEDGNEITERVDYDESLIEGHVDLSERCIRCTKKSIHNVIDEVVSLTKQLHNSLYPREEGKWIFLQLDLLSMLPVTFDTISIQIEKVIKESFSVSSIIVNGQKIGSIRFTVVVR